MSGQKNLLFRDPADWARDWGWVSPIRAERAAQRLDELAEAIDGALGEDPEDNADWPGSLRDIAKYLRKRT